MSDQAAAGETGASTEDLTAAAGADAGAPAAGAAASAAATGEGQDGQGAAAGTTAAADGAAAAGEAATGAADGDKGEGEGAKDPAWPEDWREQLAGKDEKLLKRLKRFASPKNVVTSLASAEDRIRSGVKATLPEGAGDEDVAAFRKANGIPEKAEDYVAAIKVPDGVELPPEAKKGVETFAAAMHAKNVAPAVAQEALNVYLEAEKAAEQERYDFAQRATIENKATIKAEFGRDMDRNIRLADGFIQTKLGSEGPGLMGVTLADGTKLGDNPDFIRLVVAAALDNAEDDALIGAEARGDGTSLQEQYDTALKLQQTDYKAFWKPDHQAKLVALKTKIEARGKRS